MAFVQTQSSQSIPAPQDYVYVAQWYINDGAGVPTRVQVINYSADDIQITSGLSLDTLGNPVAVAGNSTEVITVAAVGNADFYVGAQGIQQDGQCNITPGIENE